MPANNVDRLAAEGLVSISSLSGEDKQVIDSLTDAEVTVLINVAKRLYQSDPTLLKTSNLHGGPIRILVPL